MKQLAWILIGLAVLAGVSDGAAAAQLLEDRSGTAAQSGMSWLPGPAQDALRWVVAQQEYFARALRESVAAYRDGDAVAPALALIGLSFAYGVFHAIGPGHGKAVVASYFIARESQIRRGLALGWLIAGIQAAVAIVAVGALGWVLDIGRLSVLNSMPFVEAGSYGLIVVLGGVMTWRTLARRDCGHDHTGLGSGHGHAAHGHAGGHTCGHEGDDAHHEHRHGQPAIVSGEFFGAAFVAGLRPCTGALIVLLFALANGIFAVGALATVAMGVGVALTVSGVGIVAILARRGILRLSANYGGGKLAFLPRALSVLGAFTVMVIGLLLLAGALQRGF